MADDELSRVFSALADPTRRDIVARLAVGDATVGELAEPYDVTVQAVSKHLKVLEDAGLVSRTRDAQRRPVPPRGGGVRPDDEVDRALPAAGRGAVPAPRRRAGPHAGRGTHRRPATTDRTRTRKEQHHDHHHATRGHHRGRPRPPAVTITREFDAPPELVYRAWDRARAGQASGWARARSTWTSRCGTAAPAGPTATPPSATARRWPASTARSTRSRPGERLVQTFTWEGMPDGGLPGDDDLRGARGRPLPDRRRLRRRLDGGAGRDDGQRHGGRHQRGLREARRAARAGRAELWTTPPPRSTGGSPALFSDRVRGVTDWDAPSPVEGWAARDVVRHLVEWFPAFLAGGAGVELPSGPSVDDDPVEAWQTQATRSRRCSTTPRRPTGC